LEGADEGAIHENVIKTVNHISNYRLGKFSIFEYCRRTMETHATTAFAAWMDANDLDDRQASILLGLSQIMVRYLREGRRPDGEKCVPQRDTRLLMQAVAEGHVFEPYPI